MSKPIFTSQQEAFIDAFVSLLGPWGMPPTVARLYGYLLLCPDPVSLDQIAAALGMAKSSASVAARLLEKAKMVRRHSQRGSKRVLYSVSENATGLMKEQSAMIGSVGELLQENAPIVASGAAAERMRAMSRFYLSMQKLIEDVARELSAGLESGSGHSPD